MNVVRFLLLGILFIAIPQKALPDEPFFTKIAPFVGGASIGVIGGIATYHLLNDQIGLSHKNSLIGGCATSFIAWGLGTLIIAAIIDNQTPQKKIEKVLAIIATIETDPIVTHALKTPIEYFNFLRNFIAQEDFLVKAEAVLNAYAQNILKAHAFLCEIKDSIAYEDESECSELSRGVRELQKRLQNLTLEVERKKNVITTSSLFIKQTNPAFRNSFTVRY